ncbi:hypothetical protein JJJ17_16590 [Paracoccus caeni]|uniref:Uncharacterized protein n=1 Tax=Paracoccus caeni TaxID=657651 RepID=A0A934SET9_9RHOB|nr:hypothetical protein [Paracoccus caeni]MBK4217550.1 hypothetical protein [Paracoccus caeni]
MVPHCRFHRDLVAVAPQGRRRIVIFRIKPKTICLPGVTTQISSRRLLKHQQSASVALFSDPDRRHAKMVRRKHPQIHLNDLPQIPTSAHVPCAA